MKHQAGSREECGFSVMEMLVSICVLIPVMGAAVGLFSLGAKQHSTEQSSIDSNQEIRAAFEMMTTEIAQAGSHGDRSTTLSAAVSSSSSAQAVSVGDVTGFGVGDYVDVDTGTNHELVALTAVGTATITGVFRTAHAANVPVRLFAVPFSTGVYSAGLGPSSTQTGTSLRFFGDINGDGTVQYVEYIYNSGTNQITRSITPVTQATRNPAVVLVGNVKPNSVQFSITTDSRSIVTAATIAMTARSTVKSGNSFQDVELGSRISIPSAMAASALLYENQHYGGFNHIPPTPAKVSQWVTS